MLDLVQRALCELFHGIPTITLRSVHYDRDWQTFFVKDQV